MFSVGSGVNTDTKKLFQGKWSALVGAAHERFKCENVSMKVLILLFSPNLIPRIKRRKLTFRFVDAYALLIGCRNGLLDDLVTC